MTKKHYLIISEILRHHYQNGDINDSGMYEITTGLVYEFAKDNKNFDRSRFLQACGINAYTCVECGKACKNHNYHVLKSGDKGMCEQCLAKQ